MSKDPYRDQAAITKQKIERVQENTTSNKNEALPSRSELHREKKKKNKWKLKYPLISILLLFFILMPLTIFSIYSYFDSINKPFVVLSPDEGKEVEEVNYTSFDSNDSNDEGIKDSRMSSENEDDSTSGTDQNEVKNDSTTNGDKSTDSSTPRSDTQENKETSGEESKDDPKI